MQSDVYKCCQNDMIIILLQGKLPQHQMDKMLFMIQNPPTSPKNCIVCI